MHRTLRRLRDDVTVLQTEVRMLRRTFGQALENLAANYEELAPLVGLVAPPHIQGDPHEAADAEDRAD
jgi:putative heme iron utilization protein